jgi:hypothetical protein
MVVAKQVIGALQIFEVLMACINVQKKQVMESAKHQKNLLALIDVQLILLITI